MNAKTVPPETRGELTDKQREVLDLLIQHKTSKEISRLLGISPHTVDQRIMLARGKLNVSTRGDVARAYRKMVEPGAAGSADGAESAGVAAPFAAGAPAVPLCEKPIYQPSQLADVGAFADSGRREGAVVPPRPGPGAAQAVAIAPARPYYHVLPEMFDGPHGTWLRLGYMAGITFFLILIILGGLAMFTQLSTLLG